MNAKKRKSKKIQKEQRQLGYRDRMDYREDTREYFRNRGRQYGSRHYDTSVEHLADMAQEYNG